MASIVDSFRETFSDSHSLLKVLVLSIPLYFSYEHFASGNWFGFPILAFFTVLILFGFLIKTTSCVLNQADTILPSINPFKLILAALKGFVAIGPITLFSAFIGNYLCSLIFLVPWLDITLKVIIWMLVISISLTSFLLFVPKESIVDAYNLKIISNKAGDIMVGLFFFVLQLAVIDVLVFGALGYAIFVLFGISKILYFFVSVAIVYNIGIIGHYMAQMQYEFLGYDKDSF